jgi:LEA14-like dessication related protein
MARLMRVLACAMALSVCGCAGWQTEYEKPTVNVTSFRALPSEGMVPRFEIGLHILNPNRTELDLVGMSYTVSLEGREIIKGVANDLPIIAPYGEGEVTVTASASLFNSVRLITDLMQGHDDVFDYEFDAKLDFGGFKRNLHVKKEGRFSLSGRTLGTETEPDSGS